MSRFLSLALIVIIIMVFSGVTIAQEDAPVGGVNVLVDGVSEGYVLFNSIQSNEVFLIDNEGREINRWQSKYNILMAYLLDNGHLLVAAALPETVFPVGGTGRIEEYSWDGELVWSFEYASDSYLMHHDIEPMPNGNVLFTAFELIKREDLPAFGMTPEDAGDAESLFYDVVLEVDRQTSEIVWEWRVMDHFIQSRDVDAPNFGYAAAAPERFDMLYRVDDRNLDDRTHINGIDYNPDLDQVLVSVWYTSEIWIIDRQRDELVYRWGNPAAFNRGLEENRQLFLQHDPQWLPDGTISIFNNGAREIREYSQVLVIDPPLEADGTYRLVGDSAYEPLAPDWVYEDNPRTDFYAPLMSGAQHLPNENVLITNGPAGQIFEVTRDGELVWEYFNPFYPPDNPERRLMIFKARRYLPDDPAFAGRDLTAGSVLAP